MIEILCLIGLCKAIGRMLRAKGRRAGGYQFLTVVLWVVGEITGAVAGVLLELGNGVYLTTLLGAAFGALVAYTIASAVRPVFSPSAAVGPVFD